MIRSNRWDEAVIVALGSNLPGLYASSQALLDAAVLAFPDRGLRISLRSRWWRSTAWPDGEAPDYLNGVALVETQLPPGDLMLALLQIEADFGRVRGQANAPRTLDLDLIAYGRLLLETSSVVLPHPRATNRGFVMGPLAEVAPEWRHPVSGLQAKYLATQCTIGIAAPIPR